MMPTNERFSITDELRSADDATIRAAVEAADPWPLRTVMRQLTGDPRLDEMATDAGGLGTTTRAASDRMAAPALANDHDVALVREIARQTLTSYRDGQAQPPPAPSRSEFRRLLSATLGSDVPDANVDYWLEEFGMCPLPRAVPDDDLDPAKVRHFHTLVIGAGMNGLAAGVYLRAAGMPFTIVEKNSSVGGTWCENVYPGARVDVASRAYCFTFEPDYAWPHYFAEQAEILAYFDYVADKYELRERIRFDTEVESADWDEADHVWRVVLRHNGERSTFTANAIISAVGLFNRPSMAELPGIESFRGRVVHTAQWDSSYDLTHKRVAVIGTGSSGVQIVAPIAPKVKSLHIFQRAGTWIANVPNYLAEVPRDEAWVLRNVPYYVNWVRLLTLFATGDTRAVIADVDPEWSDPHTVNQMNWQLRKTLLQYVEEKVGHRPDLLARCVPSYPPLAKRLPKDNGWYDAVLQDHVELVIEPIAQVTDKGIRTTDGTERELDLIILATGFHANRFLWPMKFTGRDGTTLEQIWEKDGARAYLGMTMPSFPNFFMLYGPNTNGKSGSPISWGEMQIRYAIKCLRHLCSNEQHSIELRRDVFEDFNRLLDERSESLIWMDKRQKSYYRNEFGRSATNGAWLNSEYWQWTFEPKVDEYIVT